MEAKGWWNEENEKSFRKKARADVLEAFTKAEKYKKPPVSDLFTDVYDEMPWHLKEQQAELHDLMKKFPDHYNTSKLAPSK